MALLTALSWLAFYTSAVAASTEAKAEVLEQSAAHTLQILYNANPPAQIIGQKSKAILIFPRITKAGLVFGGSYGEGVLMKNMQVQDYYNSVSVSWGWQAGLQSYGYVVFLMNDYVLKYLERTKGWEFGVGPTVVVASQGAAKNFSSLTLRNDAYAFIFDQQGLMAGVSLEGTKISHIKP
jgi:lipid-binding SYLF domain-containing protein